MRHDPKRGRKLIKAVKEMLELCPRCQGTGGVTYRDKWGFEAEVTDEKGERYRLKKTCPVCGKVRLLLKELGL